MCWALAGGRPWMAWCVVVGSTTSAPGLEGPRPAELPTSLSPTVQSQRGVKPLIVTAAWNCIDRGRPTPDLFGRLLCLRMVLGLVGKDAVPKQGGRPRLAIALGLSVERFAPRDRPSFLMLDPGMNSPLQILSCPSVDCNHFYSASRVVGDVDGRGARIGCS
ncbi:hypothetical protein BJ875DRAFT_226448 [Amylocarpus encephaloides]|uniref:Secreted protein n=1 Tax=Amylocarpus encephaloides TaxID=45428 RepID=A0A9P7Y8C8_9HELO|nr:hypothetical protein BJ875DRAFT_226448 [Amylocarpus encephaloides]